MPIKTLGRILIFSVPKLLILSYILGFVLKLSFAQSDVVQYLSNLIISFSFIWTFWIISVFLHEIGHLVFAKIVGGIPKWLIIGYGNKVAEFKVFNVTVYIKNRLLRGGLAYAIFEKRTNFKNFALHSGGVITNLIFAVIPLIIWGYRPEFMALPPAESVVSSFIVVNFTMFIVNAIPRKIVSEGKRRDNDGMAVWKIITGKFEETESKISEIEQDEAYTLFTQHKFEEAAVKYEKFIKEDPKILANYLNLAAIHINLIEPQKAVSELDIISAKITEGDSFDYEHFLNVNYAWAFLMLDKNEEALTYAKKAKKIAPENMGVKLIYGATLIFAEKYKEGIAELEKIVDFKTTDYTLTAAIFLLFAYHKTNSTKKFEKYKRLLVSFWFIALLVSFLSSSYFVQYSIFNKEFSIFK